MIVLNANPFLEFYGPVGEIQFSTRSNAKKIDYYGTNPDPAEQINEKFKDVLVIKVVYDV